MKCYSALTEKEVVIYYNTVDLILSENKYTTQSNRYTQCNPDQATNGIFQRTSTNSFIICMGI